MLLNHMEILLLRNLSMLMICQNLLIGEIWVPSVQSKIKGLVVPVGLLLQVIHGEMVQGHIYSIFDKVFMVGNCL